MSESHEPYYQVELAKSGRAGCKGCKEKIAKGELRIGRVVYVEKFGGSSTSWYHPRCLKARSAIDMSIVKGLESVGNEALETVKEAIANAHIKKATKRKAASKDKASPKKKKSKTSKHEVVIVKKNNKSSSGETSPLEEKYKKMTVSELKEYLKVNKQVMSGKKQELVDRCVDGETNGALPICPSCGNGKLHIENRNGSPIYICKGYFDGDLGTFIRCSFQEEKVERNKWKEPSEDDGEDEDTGNAKSGTTITSVKDKFKDLTSPMEFAQKMVELAKEEKLSISEVAAESKQQIGTILMANKNDDGDFDVDAAWKDLVSKYPNAKTKEATKKVLKAKVEENTELAAIFDELAALEAKIGEENYRFKVASNKTTANAIRMLSFKVENGKDLAKGNKKKGIDKVKGLGMASAQVIDEYLENGSCEKLEELRVHAASL